MKPAVTSTVKIGSKAPRKVTVNLPADQVEFLQGIAESKGITFTDALRRAINTEQFVVEQESKNGKILVESSGSIREVIRR